MGSFPGACFGFSKNKGHHRFWGLGFRVLGFWVLSLGFWGFGFWGLGFRDVNHGITDYLEDRGPPRLLDSSLPFSLSFTA